MIFLNYVVENWNPFIYICPLTRKNMWLTKFKFKFNSCNYPFWYIRINCDFLRVKNIIWFWHLGLKGTYQRSRFKLFKIYWRISTSCNSIAISFGNYFIRRFFPSDFFFPVSSTSELARGEAFPRLPNTLSSFLVLSAVFCC